MEQGVDNNFKKLFSDLIDNNELREDGNRLSVWKLEILPRVCLFLGLKSQSCWDRTWSSCFQFTTLTTRALTTLMTYDYFNVMYSIQIIGPISFNLTVSKSFITIMQLNLFLSKRKYFIQ